MIQFKPTQPFDLPAIGEWMNLDPDHCDRMNREWWMKGDRHTILCCRVDDEMGPVMYLRLDREGDLVRLHTQFGPPAFVSKKRIALAMTTGFDSLILALKGTGAVGIVFESVSISLIQFMRGLNFVHAGGNDYVRMFEGVECVWA